MDCHFCRRTNRRARSGDLRIAAYGELVGYILPADCSHRTMGAGSRCDGGGLGTFQALGKVWHKILPLLRPDAPNEVWSAFIAERIGG